MRTIRDCNVAVVGGAGFLGSHLTNHLIKDRNCHVLVIDNLVAGRREFVPDRAEFVHHDITGSEVRLRDVFSAFKTNYVFNYAAWPYIPDSFARPLYVCDVNFMGAVKVINAAQEAGADGILQVSSAEIYGEGSIIHIEDFDTRKMIDEKVEEGKKLGEDTPVVPHSSYGASKAAVDSYVQVAWKERRTPCIALRQFNCIGERETHPYVVPEIINQLSRFLPGQIPTVMLGNNSFRDFLYAGDQARIAVQLLEKGQWGEVYNLGSERGIKVYDLAELIGKLMGFAEVQVEVDESRKRPWEIWSLLADNTKINQAIGPYMTVTTLGEGLRRTIKWFESNGRRWPWER